jgi:hypothetical protein
MHREGEILILCHQFAPGLAEDDQTKRFSILGGFHPEWSREKFSRG